MINGYRVLYMEVAQADRIAGNFIDNILMATEILRLEGIRRELELSRDVRQTIIPNLSLEIMAGEFVAITGPSGSGKSTLLYIMGGLDKPTYGKVWLDGEEITEKDETAMTRIRNEKIGFIYQFHFLLPEFNAVENVSMPMMINGRFSRKEIRERAMKLLDTVGLDNKYTNKPSQLSGGQQQRVAIARRLPTNRRFCSAMSRPEISIRNPLVTSMSFSIVSTGS